MHPPVTKTAFCTGGRPDLAIDLLTAVATPPIAGPNPILLPALLKPLLIYFAAFSPILTWPCKFTPSLLLSAIFKIILSKSEKL